MKRISNYIDNSFYTFETSVIGKEYIKVYKGKSQVLIPGFQVEIKINDENKFFNKEYFLFDKVSSFKARYSYYDSDLIDEYSITIPSHLKNTNKKIEFESLAIRDNSITFCTYFLEFDKLDIYYDKQVDNVKEIHVSNLDLIITTNELFNFLNLNEIDLNSGKELDDILLNV